MGQAMQRPRCPVATALQKTDWVGALTLVKRTWHLAYLALPKEEGGWGFAPSDFCMPNTRGVAAHEPFANLDDEDDPEDILSSEKHYAVLAFDGDEIGKWVSGAKTPAYQDQLADYWDGSGAQRFGARVYFQGQGLTSFLASRRALSPSYHLQFSEALSNFALLCARPVVEAFDGRLIYAGGDDVVALLPADTALPCAQALRMAFQGDNSLAEFLAKHAARLQSQHEKRAQKQREQVRIPPSQSAAAEGGLFSSAGLAPGFLACADRFDQSRRPIPFLVPGPAADCSVGIAMAHFKAPLQDVVRAAQAAEKRSKHQLGRSAVAVTLFKRSGEILEWGCKWDDGGLALLEALLDAMGAGQLSGKFPHRLAELIEPYLTSGTPLQRDCQPPTAAVLDDSVLDVFRLEIRAVLDRQTSLKGEAKRALIDRITPLFEYYLDSSARRFEELLHGFEERRARYSECPVKTDFLVHRLSGLLSAVAFAHRTTEKPDSDSTPKGN